MENEAATAFIDCILSYSKNLESNTISPDLEVLIKYFILHIDRTYSTD